MKQTWVYIRSESSLWTVGFYSPDGAWHSDSDHYSQEEAAVRVHFLNGGNRMRNKFLNGGIEQLELSVRVYNSLSNAGIRTIQKLVSVRGDSDLLRLQGFGRKSLNEVKTMLAGVGLRLGMTEVKP